MSPQVKRGRYDRWPMVVWLTLVWVLLWGHLTVANVLAGLVIGLLLVHFTPMPRVGFEGRVWLPGVVVLVARFVVDVLRASVQVSTQALRIGHHPHGAVIRVQLRSHSDLFLTLTAELCSLVPGSIVVEAHRLTGTLYVHVLDVDQAGGVDRAKLAVLEQERRVLSAFASDTELAEVGLPPRRGTRRGPQRNREVAA
ncbi:MAG: Na+/H+ antiporter subunit E [Actinomycetales bacterium]|nr:Na+/H+ antiporter subunit E [Actinomycetales bacterium]